MTPSSARCLWWAIEQQMWSISDLLRLAHATKLLSGGDHMLLHARLKEVENIVRMNKEETGNAL